MGAETLTNTPSLYKEVAFADKFTIAGTVGEMKASWDIVQ